VILTEGEFLSVDEQKLVVENHLAINLSPQTAKSLLHVLAGQIQAYEQQYGEIRYNPIQPQTEEPVQPQQPENPPQPRGLGLRIRFEEEDKKA
jgi:hypothetical protein